MNAKVNTADKGLKALYNPCFESLCTKNHTTDKHFNPLLIKCPEHYFDDNNVRIMVIGDATKRWYKDLFINDVDECLDCYKTFVKQKDKKSIGCYEQYEFVDSLNKIVNGDNAVDNIIWTNVYKTTENVSFTNAIPGRSEQCRIWRQMHLDITAKEIQILKPEFVFFITGNDMRNDSTYINGCLGWDIHFVEVKEDKDMAMVIGRSKKMDYICFRLPNPGKESPKRNQQILELTKKIISNYRHN